MDHPDIPAGEFQLLENIKTSLPRLKEVQAMISSDRAIDDGLYRLYSHSVKVQKLDYYKRLMAKELFRLLPKSSQLGAVLAQILGDCSGDADLSRYAGGDSDEPFNDRLVRLGRQDAEAVLHLKRVLELAIHYGQTLEQPPANPIPSSWALLLSAFGLR